VPSIRSFRSGAQTNRPARFREAGHELINHRLQQGTGGTGFVFPSSRKPDRPFAPRTVALHTHKAWKTKNLAPIGLHECRHTYAAYMIAAGINTKALSTYMGHASITITLDRYGHLLPGNENEAATLLENWLSATTTRSAKPHGLSS
jgi:integrase